MYIFWGLPTTTAKIVLTQDNKAESRSPLLLRLSSQRLYRGISLPSAPNI